MIKKGLTIKQFKISNRNSHRDDKPEHNDSKTYYLSKPNSAFTSIHTIKTDAERVKRKINMNDEILHKRKQNYLNTQYNRRINQLKQITKDNKKIYERINSQKSLYSQQDMRKSSVSIRSLSRCSSKSRVSQQSKNSKQRAYKTVQKFNKKNIAVTIQPQSVNNIKSSNINQFKSMFLREKPIQQNGKGSMSHANKQNRSFSLRASDPQINKDLNMGNMLHKIAQQMYVHQSQRKQPLKNNKRRLLH